VPGLRLYLDENVDVRVAEGLRRHGVEVLAARDAGMLGASDAEQMAYAHTRQAVLVTCDHHFLALAAALVRSREHHHGVIYLARRRAGVGEYVRRLALCAQVLEPMDLVDRIEFL
jgi:hypothetical protein